MTGNTDTADNNAATSPDQQKSPGTTVAAPVTPYMNSAALNEIAGELLVTVRELRDELLQVSGETVKRTILSNLETLANTT